MPARFFLELAYRGTQFHGWQRQHNAISVQETLEKALGTVLKTPTAIIGCGRTDTGVHAAQYFAHFDAPDGLPATALPHLNGLVAPDIVVHRIHAVAEKAHARFDATQRAYDYYLHLRHDPFRKGLSTCYPYFKLDFDRMNQAAAELLQHKDFPGFQKTGSGAKTSLCRVDQAEWQPVITDYPVRGCSDAWVFRIAADRFLRGMVRMIVGSLFEVGRGHISLEEYAETVAAGRRFDRITAAAPDGLYLSRVHYPYLNPELVARRTPP